MKRSFFECIFFFLILSFTLFMSGCSREIERIAVTSVVLDYTTLELQQGDTYVIMANVIPAEAENKELIWTSGKQSVVRLTEEKDGKCILTAVKPGYSRITVKSLDGDKSATCDVKVVPCPIGSVTLEQKEIVIDRGGKATLKAIVEPEHATYKNLIWSSSDKEIVEVVEDGTQAILYGLKKGSAKVIAQTKDGGLTDTCEVKVLSLDVDRPEVNLSGAAQSFTFEIQGDYNWRIINNSTWMEVDQKEGHGDAVVTVSVENTIYESRRDKIHISWGEQITDVIVSQEELYHVTQEETLVYKIRSYADLYEFYGKTVRIDLAPEVQDSSYVELIPELEQAYYSEHLPIRIIGSDGRCVVPGISVYVNGNLLPKEYGFYILQDFTPSEYGLDSLGEQESLEDFQAMAREVLYERFRKSWIDFGYSRPDDYNKPHVLMNMGMVNDESKEVYILGWAPKLYTMAVIPWNYLNYEYPVPAPEVGPDDYGMAKDRWDGRKFKDEEGNLYTLQFMIKRGEEMMASGMDLEIMSLINLTLNRVPHFPVGPDITYPLFQVFKNGEPHMELMLMGKGDEFNSIPGSGGLQRYGTWLSGFARCYDNTLRAISLRANDVTLEEGLWLLAEEEYGLMEPDTKLPYDIRYKKYKLFPVDDGRKPLAAVVME